MSINYSPSPPSSQPTTSDPSDSVFQFCFFALVVILAPLYLIVLTIDIILVFALAKIFWFVSSGSVQDGEEFPISAYLVSDDIDDTSTGPGLQASIQMNTGVPIPRCMPEQKPVINFSWKIDTLPSLEISTGPSSEIRPHTTILKHKLKKTSSGQEHAQAEIPDRDSSEQPKVRDWEKDYTSPGSPIEGTISSRGLLHACIKKDLDEGHTRRHENIGDVDSVTTPNFMASWRLSSLFADIRRKLSDPARHGREIHLGSSGQALKGSVGESHDRRLRLASSAASVDGHKELFQVATRRFPIHLEDAIHPACCQLMSGCQIESSAGHESSRKLATEDKRSTSAIRYCENRGRPNQVLDISEASEADRKSLIELSKTCVFHDSFVTDAVPKESVPTELRGVEFNWPKFKIPKKIFRKKGHEDHQDSTRRFEGGVTPDDSANRQGDRPQKESNTIEVPRRLWWFAGGRPLERDSRRLNTHDLRKWKKRSDSLDDEKAEPGTQQRRASPRSFLGELVYTVSDGRWKSGRHRKGRT